MLTPDSSRFWPGDEYAEGKDQPSFDKQFVRDWLNANWDRQGNPPRLPQDIIDRTSEKYIQAYEKITGRTSFRLPNGNRNFSTLRGVEASGLAAPSFAHVQKHASQSFHDNSGHLNASR